MYIRRFFAVFLVGICSKLVISSELRPRRSLAPFLGAGGSNPSKMRISRDHWHCGSDENSRSYTHNEIGKNCPSLAAAVNHCCAVHDDCYGQQLGQDKCDRDFCECNRVATRLPTEEGFKCRGMLEDACTVLGVLGFFAYGSSNYTDPAKPSNVEPVAPKTVPEIENDYLQLYEKCPFVNITMSSCSFNFDLCANVHSVDFCANDLCHCMLDAAESDPIHRKKCTESVAHTCRLALRHSSEILTNWSKTKFNLVLTAVILLSAAVSGYIAFSMWSKREQRRKEENGKYLHIHTVESSRSVNPLLINAN